MISASAPAQVPGSARSARGTPRKVTSGPYIPPSRAIGASRLHDQRRGQYAPAGQAPGVLARAGLVTGSREGREVRYAVHTGPLASAADWLAGLAAEWGQGLAAIKRIAGSG